MRSWKNKQINKNLKNNLLLLAHANAKQQLEFLNEKSHPYNLIENCWTITCLDLWQRYSQKQAFFVPMYISRESE